MNILKMVQMKPEIMELMEGLVREMNHDDNLVTEYKTWKNENERINASIINEVRKDGITEGIKENRKAIILNMYHENIPLDIISKCTNLSVEEVQEIINNK